ncbi:LysM peptidoglycan-binding domain-containing protein [Faecalicatena contorta]|uniref:LysM domain-containing protein n=1 Tax=Faecalicatena contorta TaxID=39482 RepID=A0A315ZZ22_9FIRM|nr:LysM peptidoglycan-binding domain-containing protein [Faecalicatena contorta]PWJ50573.1 LysM domain-containing protein [Faecalicatena contorta]SUQ13981.1 LysM domain-containing protein [Faecalicatena contorta]
MERQIPKNVRQIGNVSDTPKIYVEDYVDTFFAQLCEKAGEGPIGAFLVGDMQKTNDEEYVYIYGAIQIHDLQISGKDYVIDDDAWKRAYEECKQYFEDGEMLGWFVAHQGVPLEPEHNTVKFHKKSFPKKNTVFIMKDPVEKDEVYYVLKLNDLMEIGGHYTYYEKNPCMQNYMISTRKKNGVCPSETVEDRAAKDFRSLVRTREEQLHQKRTNRLMYAVSACLVLVVIIMGVTTLNNFDKMKSVQSTLNSLSNSSSSDTQSVEARETNGNVTAVTGEPSEQQVKDDSQENKAQEEEGQAVGDASDEQNSNDGAQDADTSQTSSGANGSDGVYIVEQGDTLAVISRKTYGDVSHVDAICKMNGLTDGNLIYVGQKLVLP